MSTAVQAKEKYWADPEAARAKVRAYRAANPEKSRETSRLSKARRNKRHDRRVHGEYQLRRTFGITGEDWARMFEAQAGCCAGCWELLDGERHTHVDHCHTTCRVRGLLCSSCNLAIGKLNDSPATLRRLADYLER